MSRRAASIVVAVVFAGVVLSFLVYTQRMGDVLRRDAEVFSAIYANAFQGATATEPRSVDDALFNILQESLRLQIPIVLTDVEGEPTSAANLPFEFDLGEPASAERVRAYVTELDARIPPYEVPGYDLTIHYGEPHFLGRLKWIPWLQAAVLLVTVGGGGWLIYTSFRGERERIWSAMARESAHQMGTPLSSLSGWLEHLERQPAASELRTDEIDLVEEMEADVGRLLKVSNRFELIGRSPELEPVRVDEVVGRLERYFSLRLPSLGRAVAFRVDIPETAPAVLANATLLEWAFENLVKNSMDALAGREGTIGIAYVETREDGSVYRIHDSGPGVAPEVRSSLFEIGVTTKERGWGVGLSLTRRIVEEMHGGEISLEPTESGTSFRVVLPVAGEA